MLVFKASPRASISSAQKGSTGQNPWNTKNIAKTSENRHVQAKNSLAAEGVSEQFGASSMRCSMGERITQRRVRLAANCRLTSSSETVFDDPARPEESRPEESSGLHACPNTTS